MSIGKRLKAFSKLPLGTKIKKIGKKALEAAPNIEKVAAARVGMTNPTGLGGSPIYRGGIDKVINTQ